MPRGKELIKNTGILFIGKVSTQVVNFLLIPFYTTLLSTGEYGEIDIYASLAMIVVPFLTLQLEMGMFRFFIESNSDKEKKEIVSTSLFLIAKILIVASIAYWLGTYVFQIRYKREIYGYYLVISISSLLLQMCRADGNNIAYGVASFLISSLTVVFNVVFIFGFRLNVKGVLIATILSNIISSVYMVCTVHIGRYIHGESISKAYAKRLLRYSVPLVFNQISSWIINYSDRIIILFFWGTATNGIYSLANKFSNIISTFFGVYNLAWSENVIRCKNDPDSLDYIRRIFELTFKLYLILITGVINLLPFIFLLLVNGNYILAYGHIPILLLAMFFSGMAAMVGSIYIAYGKTIEVSITTVSAGLCNIVIHLILLGHCKLYAASISTLVSFILLFVYRCIFVKRFLKFKFEMRKVFLQIMIYGFSWIAYFCNNRIMVVFGLLTNLLCVYHLYKSNSQQLFSLLNRKRK